MPEFRTYSGGCHCGQVRYEVELQLQRVMECNCSHCSKKAFLLAFVPPEKFRLLQGEAALTDYQFNRHNIHHLFCSACGVQSYGWGTGKDGGRMISINVRCLDGVDVAGLQIQQVDGKSF